MKTISTNTGMLQLVDVGTYQGICDADNILNGWRLQEDFDEGYTELTPEQYWFNFNNKKYMEWLKEKAEYFVVGQVLPEIKELNIGVLDIKVTGMFSPREYNFDTDRLLFDLEVENYFEDRLVKVIDELNVEDYHAFELYLKEEFTSRSGFISFIPNYIDGFVEKILEGDDRCISVFLQWYFYLKLDIYNSSWDDNNMEQWYQFIQETDCDCYGFLNEPLLLEE